MTTRTINKALIRKLVKEKGVELTAVEAKCSASLIWKLMSEEHKVIPAIQKIDGLCFALNKSIEELFPISEVSKESA